MKECSPFGPMLREERLKAGVQLWRFAAMVPFPASNIHRIEMGVTEPRISLAIKMLLALNIDVGMFMGSLAESQHWPVFQLPAGFSGEKLTEIAPNLPYEYNLPDDKSKALFGMFFRQVRLACEISQSEIAERAGYTVRSLIAVERGKQEPMVMRAIRLVQVTGMEVPYFFRAYDKLQAAHI